MSKDKVLKQAIFASYHRINKKYDNGRYRNENGDLILVKEKWKDENGKMCKRVRPIENFERPFWITKKIHRNHQDKREWESLENVDMFRSPQWCLSLNVQKALKMYNPDPNLPIRMVNRNPYVYGTDLSPTFLIMEAYSHRNKGYRAGPCDVAFLDIETDVLGVDEDRIILVSTTYENHCIVYALEEFISRTTLDYDRQFHEILDKDLPDVKGKFGYTVELRVFKEEIKMIRAIFDDLHRCMPDYVGGWNNLSFDQVKLAKRIAHYGEDPADYFSDPRIPPKYRNYYFREGKKFSVSDSGKKTNLRPIQRWHEVDAPASFQWIDSMCVYYQLRKVKGMESSYRLDYIMDKVIGLRKYEIEEAASKKGLTKHIFMQKYYPVHYAVYSAFDTIGLDLMDKKTGDLRNTFGVLLGDSDLRSNQSNPTKLADALHAYLYREEQYVLGSTSDQMFNWMDDELPPLDGWIVALPTVLLDDNVGMPVVKETPGVLTKFSNHAADDDIESSYPLGGILANMSRETTTIEVREIVGLSKPERYRVGLNMMAGCVNSVSNAKILFRMDDFVTLESKFDNLYSEYRQSIAG